MAVLVITENVLVPAPDFPDAACYKSALQEMG